MWCRGLVAGPRHSGIELPTQGYAVSQGAAGQTWEVGLLHGLAVGRESRLVLALLLGLHLLAGLDVLEGGVPRLLLVRESLLGAWVRG